MIRWVVILFSLLLDVHGHVRHPKDHFRPRLPPTPSPDSCDSEQADSPAQRIIGDTPGDEGAFPFMAKIVFDGGGGLCGGTLISPNYVMTAAHCAYEILETGIENVIIGLGTNRLLNCNGLWVGIDSIVMCPNYSGGTWGKDIAIAKLHRPVDYPPLIQPIHIYGGDVNFTMTMKLATVAGWGLYSSAFFVSYPNQHFFEAIILSEQRKEKFLGNWTASFTSCSKQHKNGTLVSIQNGFENSAIADEFRDRGDYWIGLNVTNGVWAWLDGQNLTYTNWANGEPSQTSGCVMVDPKTVKWSVTACEGVNVAVCEIFL